MPHDDAQEDSHYILRLVHKEWNQVPSITITNTHIYKWIHSQTMVRRDGIG